MCDSQTDIANNRLRRQRRATEEEVVLTGQVRVKMPGETLEDNSKYWAYYHLKPFKLYRFS